MTNGYIGATHDIGRKQISNRNGTDIEDHFVGNRVKITLAVDAIVRPFEVFGQRISKNVTGYSFEVMSDIATRAQKTMSVDYIFPPYGIVNGVRKTPEVSGIISSGEWIKSPRRYPLEITWRNPRY